MDVQNKSTKVQVVYQLSREGKLEHPHMIEVPILSIQEGLRLKGTQMSLVSQYLWRLLAVLHDFRHKLQANP